MNGLFIEVLSDQWQIKDHESVSVAETPLLRVSHLYPAAKVVNFGGGALGLSQNEGEAFPFRVNPYRMKLSAKQTNGQCMMMEGTLLPGEGTVTQYVRTITDLL